MKTKLSAIVVLFFLMACGSSDQSKEEKNAVPEAGVEKYIVKAFNMKYISLTSNGLLLANEADPTKAEVFEKMDIGGGKYNLKASNGMFVCDDRAKGDSLFADKPKASDWEQFEIIAVDESKTNIKSSTGKFVSCNLDAGGVIFSKYDKASDWELFYLEKK